MLVISGVGEAQAWWAEWPLRAPNFLQVCIPVCIYAQSLLNLLYKYIVRVVTVLTKPPFPKQQGHPFILFIVPVHIGCCKNCLKSMQQRICCSSWVCSKQARRFKLDAAKVVLLVVVSETYPPTDPDIHCMTDGWKEQGWVSLVAHCLCLCWKPRQRRVAKRFIISRL